MSALATKRAKGELRGIHVFWMIFAFFAVSICVNAFFITRAIASFPGEDEQNAYVQGNDFNTTIAQRKAQQQLGWTAEAGLQKGQTGRQNLVLHLTDLSGRPVTGRNVEARWRIAGVMREDASLRLPEVSPGEYRNILPIPGPGRIVLTFRVPAQGDEPAFEAAKTLELP